MRMPILLLLLWVSAAGRAETLTLKQAVVLAQKNHPDIQEASEAFKSAGAAFWGHISPASPTLFVEGGGIPEGRGVDAWQERKYGVAQPLDFPLSYWFKGQSAHSGKNAQKANLDKTRLQVIAGVKRRYFRAVMLKKQSNLFLEMSELTETLFNKAKTRYFAGDVSPYDTLKFRVELTAAQNRQNARQQEFQVAKKSLGLWIGLSGDGSYELSDNGAYHPLSLSVDSLLTAALAAHPQVEMARAQYSGEKARYRLAWTGLLPQVSVKAFRQETRSVSDTRWGGEVGLSVPLWFFMKNQGEIRSARHRANAAAWQVTAAQKRVRENILKAYARVKVSDAQIASYQKEALKESDELVRMASRSYEEGEMSYLEMAEAMKTKIQVHVDYLEALYAYFSALADLEAASGVSLLN